MVTDSDVEPEDSGSQGDDENGTSHNIDAVAKRVGSVRKLKDRLREAESRLAQYESLEETRAEESERKAQDWAKLEKRLSDKMSSREQRIAELESIISERQRADRETALLDSVEQRTGANRTLLKGLLKVASESGFDTAPDELDDDVVVDAVKRVRALAPELFEGRGYGGSPGAPGLNTKIKPVSEQPMSDSDARVAELAKRMSDYGTRNWRELNGK